MENIWLILSLTLNVVLSIIAFFKTSLNDVVSEIGKSLIEHRRKKKEILIRTHSLVKKLDKSAFISLIELGQLESRLEEDPSYKNKFSKDWSTINDEIESNELFLPKKARMQYRLFRDTVKRFGSEISRDKPGRSRYLEMNKEIERIAESLLEEIEEAI